MKGVRPLKIVGLTLGDPNDPSSRSGVNHNIFSRLRLRCDLVDVFDLDVKGWQKVMLAATHFSPNRKVWGNKVHQNPRAFWIRTQTAEKVLANIRPEYELVFQDGAMFLPGRSCPVPFVSYHDSNILLSARGGPLAHGAHYVGSELRETIQQETEVYKRASLIFVMSEWLKQSLIKDFSIPENKIKTVYAGVNIDFTEGHKEYDGKTILFVGKNFERKGGVTLLNAFRIVKKTIPDARLIIIGPQLRIDEEGVESRGLVKDKEVLASAFREASVFVLPSYYEPFGIAFCEAFAYKLPCIGTNICAMPEIIEHNKGGVLVAPDDCKSLARSICDILKDVSLAREMGDYGHAKVRNTFNWDVVVDKMIYHCSNLLS